MDFRLFAGKYFASCFEETSVDNYKHKSSVELLLSDIVLWNILMEKKNLVII